MSIEGITSCPKNLLFPVRKVQIKKGADVECGVRLRCRVIGRIEVSSSLIHLPIFNLLYKRRGTGITS